MTDKTFTPIDPSFADIQTVECPIFEPFVKIDAGSVAGCGIYPNFYLEKSITVGILTFLYQIGISNWEHREF
jgi:hypothetical protein